MLRMSSNEHRMAQEVSYWYHSLKVPICCVCAMSAGYDRADRGRCMVGVTRCYRNLFASTRVSHPSQLPALVAHIVCRLDLLRCTAMVFGAAQDINALLNHDAPLCGREMEIRHSASMLPSLHGHIRHDMFCQFAR
jgi:hypothetical protein